MDSFVCTLQRIDKENGPADLAFFNAFVGGKSFMIAIFIGAKFMDNGKP